MPIILLTTMLTLSALYAPQPLLPVIMSEFGVSRASAAFLTTVSFFPLCIAPLVYGSILEAWPPRRMLRWAVLLLALSEFLFYLGESFAFLVAVRFFQGLLIPAILTALMTYVSQVSERSAVQRAMAVYIAATILGGFLGRACSGAIAAQFGWRISFLVLGFSLLASFALLGRLRGDTQMKLAKPRPQAILEVLREGGLLRLYLAVFCLFLVFAAMMNFIPFRLTEISDDANEFRIGLMYCGYLMGIVTSLSAVRIGRRLGGEIRAMALGLALYSLTLLGFAPASVPLLFGAMFLFCGAMFLVHATASGVLNSRATHGKGVVNGLYVSFYYGGGTVGSYAPGLIYKAWGWSAFLAALLVAALAGLALVWSCRGRLAPACGEDETP